VAETYKYGPSFAAVTAATMLAYSVFTIKTTSWRTKFRKQANAADNKAATVAVDSLINYEAVKVQYIPSFPYFSANSSSSGLIVFMMHDSTSTMRNSKSPVMTLR
jgi:ABC-type transport system involved in Fe-S cluster assembly fused permease/ATPase subunit